MRRCLIAVGLLISSLGSTPAKAQEAGQDSVRTRQVQIESADVLEVDQVDGEQIYRLDGNVVLIQEETVLKADRAVQFVDSELIVFEGRVEIEDEGDTLRADRIEYRTDVKVATGSGNVEWTDGAVHLSSLEGSYRVDDKIAQFRGQVLMRDSSSTVSSASGEYYVEEEVAVFANDVRLDQEDLVLFADSVRHERPTGITRASGDVVIYQSSTDTSNARTVLLAGKAESSRDANTNRVWLDPVLARLSADGDRVDTLVVRADRLEVTAADSSESFSAFTGARFWRGDLSGSSDTLHYAQHDRTEEGRIQMIGSPVLWSSDAQVTGDSIHISLADGHPLQLQSGRNAFVALRDSASGFVQQIRGTYLEAGFRRDTLEQMSLSPQAEALYFEAAEPEDEPSAVRFTSSEIRIRFAGNEVDKIVASTDVQGRIVAFDEAGPPSLDGFDWKIDERPDRPTMVSTELLLALESWPAGDAGSDPATGIEGTGSD